MTKQEQAEARRQPVDRSDGVILVSTRHVGTGLTLQRALPQQSTSSKQTISKRCATHCDRPQQLFYRVIEIGGIFGIGGYTNFQKGARRDIQTQGVCSSLLVGFFSKVFQSMLKCVMLIQSTCKFTLILYLKNQHSPRVELKQGARRDIQTKN